MSKRPRRVIRVALMLLTLAVLALGGLIPVVDIVTGAPQLDANRSNTTYTQSGGATVLAPQLTIADPTDSTIDGARVSITANLSATDVLGYNDSACSGLTCAYDSTTGILAISGDADASTYQAVLRTVTYNDTDPGAGEPPRTIAFSLGAADNYFPGTGHYYEVVTPDSTVRWTTANASAAQDDYFGLQGYLVTITSQAESTYITDKLDGVGGWLGASDEAEEGNWTWMGGPEAGQQFWDGPAAGNGGNTIGGRFANWISGEPNNRGGEDYAYFTADGRWNDVPDFRKQVYVVEYGGSTGDPTLQLSDEVTVSHFQFAPRFGASPTVATAFTNRTTGTVHAVENSTNITFTATGVTDPEGDAVTITWDFGDSTTATGATVTHTYGDVISAHTGSRTYTPTVTISDGQKTNTSATLPTVTVHGDLDGDGLADADGLTGVLSDSDDDGDGIADVDDPAPAVATLGTLRGTVTTAAGQPPAGGTVTAVSPTFAYRNTTSLAAAGTYTLDLPVGTYTVTVTPTDGAPVRAEATTDAGETTTLDQTLDPSGTLLVTVTDTAGTPQSGVDVAAARAATATHATTNDTGVARLTPAAGRYMVDVFADGAGAAAEPVTVTADTTTTLALETSSQTVLHAAVRITEGPGTTTLGGDAIVPVASVTDGLLQVQLVDDGEAGRDTSTVGSPADLGRFGVDASTRFAFDVTVTNYTPSSLLWAIRDPTMSVTANGTTPGAADITVSGSPVTMAVTTAEGQQTGPIVGADPATVAWPSGADDLAETLYNHTISVALYDLSLMSAERRDALDGLSVTTNAQRVGLPAVTDERKRIWVGGPGFRPDGSAHSGFYQVTLPPAQLSAWGVTDADQQLLLEQAGTTRSTTLERIGADTRLTTTDISYSASFVELIQSVPSPPATDTDSGGGGGSAPGAVGGPTVSGEETPGRVGKTIVTTLYDDDAVILVGDGTTGSGSSLVSIGFERDDDTETRVGVGVLLDVDSEPEGMDFAAGADIRFPDRTDTSTIRLIRKTIRTESVRARGRDPSTLTIYHHDLATDEWEYLETDRREVGEYTHLTARPVGFSVYGVFAEDLAQQTAEPTLAPTPTPTPTATPQPATPAEPSAPAPRGGFLHRLSVDGLSGGQDFRIIGGALGVALLLLLAAVRRRRLTIRLRK